MMKNMKEAKASENDEKVIIKRRGSKRNDIENGKEIKLISIVLVIEKQ
jgi:hypothetical protein